MLGKSSKSLQVTRLGESSKFSGFGSKYEAVLPHLETLNEDDLVVVSDGRDVLMNIMDMTEEHQTESFVEKFYAMAGADAIVVSAEPQCCVSALTYAQPGDYFHATERAARACSSGTPGCMWKGDEFAYPWESFMQTRADDKNFGEASSIFLNAGLMAGTVKNLKTVLTLADIQESEDDQAVLTDLMYNFPQLIELDYENALFGNNQGSECMFVLTDENILVHKDSKTSPLFIHSPGSGTVCHEELLRELGQVTKFKASVVGRRRLREWKSRGLTNYKCPDGYKKDHYGWCVKTWCDACYQCPKNSQRKPNRECYNNFDDCECVDGYVKSGHQCVQESSGCPEGYTYDPHSGRCVSCPSGYTYDPVSCKCVPEQSSGCPSGYEYDPHSGKCVSCPDGYTYDAQSGHCIQQTSGCPSGYEYNPHTGYCVQTQGSSGCPSGYTYDSSTGYCREDCPSGYTYDPHSGYCISDGW